MAEEPPVKEAREAYAFPPSLGAQSREAVELLSTREKPGAGAEQARAAITRSAADALNILDVMREARFAALRSARVGGTRTPGPSHDVAILEGKGNAGVRATGGASSPPATSASTKPHASTGASSGVAGSPVPAALPPPATVGERVAGFLGGVFGALVGVFFGRLGVLMLERWAGRR